MMEFPPRTSVETEGADEERTEGVDTVTADVFRDGHLWTEELVDGDPLRFHVTDAGFLAFGDDEGVFAHDAVPLRYRAAVRTVREAFARDAFVTAVERPESVTFFGVATHARGLAYDLERIPPFLGTALHDADRNRYLPPDTVQQAFDRVGLSPIDPIEKELRAAHVDPTEYPIPDSRYYDGPAAGVVFHNKGGGSAVHRNPAVEPSDATVDAADDTPDSVDASLEERVTDDDLDRAIAACGGDGRPGVETVLDRVLERLARETWAFAEEKGGSDEHRSELADRVDRKLRT